MQENTNRAIVINAIVNYAKMGITVILALLTTRYSLKALGVSDFGLFAVLGSIITFFGVFNTIMLATCNRFLAIAIGKGDTLEVNKQFNANLVIFIGIAVVTLLVACPVGFWYIHNYINYDGPEENAIMVFLLSLIGVTIATISTPYNGLLMAKERFFVFCLVEVAAHTIRFVVALLLVNYFNDKLFVYTLTMAITSALPTLVYWLYCRCCFRDYTKWNIVKDKTIYRTVFSFSGWVGYGAVACILRNQGAALLVNAFFNTIMNTALGLANSLNGYIVMFANNLTQPMQPQITKSYASGNFQRVDDLLIMSTKFSFILMLLVSCPFFVGANFIFTLWLGDIPDYVIPFTILLIVDNLVQSFNSGVSTVLFASGKIALYQIVINTLRIFSIVVAFFILKVCDDPYALFYTYIFFSVISLFATQFCLKKSLHYDVRNLIKKSYIPSVKILILFFLVFLLPNSLHQLLKIIIAIIYLIFLVLTVGLNREERKFIVSRIKK